MMNQVDKNVGDIYYDTKSNKLYVKGRTKWLLKNLKKT